MNLPNYSSAVDSDLCCTLPDVPAAVAELRERGIAVCVVRGGKHDLDAGWPTRSAEVEEFDRRSGIGIVTGPLSDCGRPGHALVAVDLDAPRAIELADQFLPQTGLIEGRPGAPRSHRYFLTAHDSIPAEDISTAEQAAPAALAATGHAGPKSTKFAGPDGGELLALKGTGGQAVCPPSMHFGSGTRREWDGGAPGEPAVVSYPALLAACRALAGVCGWSSEPRAVATARAIPSSIDHGDAYRRAALYCASDRTPPAIEGAGGHDQLWRVALAVVRGFDLGAESGCEVLSAHYNSRCVPPWSEAELRHKCQDADQLSDDPQYPRGHMLGALPAVPEDEPPVTNPHRLARSFRATRSHLRHWRGRWWEYAQGAYLERDEADLSAALVTQMQVEFADWARAALKAWRADGEEGPKPSEPPVTRRLTADVLAVLRALSQVSSEVEQPSWLDGRPGPALVVVRNGLLDLSAAAEGRSDCLYPHSPEHFAAVALPYDYDPQAPAPKQWLTFLGQVLPGDPDAVRALQEWAGYLLSGSTAQQKILLMVGPPRAGKGTIQRTLTALLGARNVGSLTADVLGGRWGLASIASKSAAAIPDARFDSKSGNSTLVERLLSISGEDELPIEEKGKPIYTARIPARLMIGTNQTPRLPDASTALGKRFLALRFTRSFLGREDTGLDRKLRSELGGILLWALAGWLRLSDQGRFTDPASSRVITDEVAALGSPISQFVGDTCDIGDGPEYTTTKRAIYGAWQAWCEENNQQRSLTGAQFGAELRSVVYHLGEARPRADGKRTEIYTGLRLKDAPMPRGV